MTITWYGQACFRFESKDLRVLIDPFDKKIGLKPPRVNDQIVLVTHEHEDHNSVPEVDANTFLVRGPGEYEKSGVQIVGLHSYHDEKEGAERGSNTIYVIKMEDITLCHLGDLGQSELSAEQIEMIGGVDILFVPVGGTYTIDAKTAAAVVKQIEPKIIVPMHYKVAGLTIDLDGPAAFLKEIALQPEEVESLKIAAKSLPQEAVRLVTFTL